MLQQLEIDGFNFEDVDWRYLNLLDNEIMSSTDAIAFLVLHSACELKNVSFSVASLIGVFF